MLIGIGRGSSRPTGNRVRYPGESAWSHPLQFFPASRHEKNNENQRFIMKVVLFCGGMGMRMREYSEAVPKPMIPIGYRPIIWHVMKYYAHYGHKDFILCLG